MEKKEFILSVKNAAIRGYLEHNIFASVTIAQAILESGWGSSGLTRKGNNLFGIKAGGSWTGKVCTMETREYNSRNEPYTITASFRAYDTLEDSLADHTKLLLVSRYKPVREAKNYAEACRKLKECGYATDPKYPEKLISLITENKLFEYDKKATVDVTSSSHVLLFQQLMNKLGIKDYDNLSLVEDNKPGPRTMSTVAKLGAIRQGCKGDVVRFIQDMVGASVDGKFGPETNKKVFDYQVKMGIKADGIVGIETFTTFLKKGK